MSGRYGALWSRVRKIEGHFGTDSERRLDAYMQSLSYETLFALAGVQSGGSLRVDALIAELLPTSFSVDDLADRVIQRLAQRENDVIDDGTSSQ